MHPIQQLQTDSNATSIIAGRWFCLFNVQAGVVIFSSMGCVLMMTVTLLNLGAEENPEALHNRSTYYAILYCYTLPMLIGFSLLYVGANKPDVNLLIVGLAIQCAFGVYWIAITVLSFIDKPNYVFSVCIDNRCPETLWLYNTEWRTYGNECIVHVDDLLVAPPKALETAAPNEHDGNVKLPAKNNRNAIGNPTIQRHINYGESRSGENIGGLVGGRSMYGLQNYSENGDIQDKNHNNHTVRVSGNHNGTHYDHSVGEHNRTNGYGDYGNPWNADDLGKNSTLLTGKNQSSATTRFARLAESTEDVEAILEALLKLLGKKSFGKIYDADKLRAALYGSRVLGCTENIGTSTAKSVVGAVIWFVFLVYGNLGAFMLITELRQMAALETRS